MELNNSHNDNTRSTMMDLIRNRYQDRGVGESLNDNEELLRRMGRHVESLLCSQNVDEALAVAKEMTFMVPASSTGALYERLVSKYKELSDKMDNARASMATLYNCTQKIDFISILPFDIVSKLVDYFWATVSNMHVITPTFLYVSKQWHKKILECTPYLSYQLLAATQYDHETAPLSHASRIRRMMIHISGDTTSCYENYDRSYARGVCTAVRHNYNLDEVMERCPNLVSLKWSGYPLSGGSGKQYPQMRALQLRGYEDELDELCEKLPCLVVLSILNVLDIDYLNRIIEYCPLLKCLIYNALHGDMIQWPYEWDKSLGPGIQELVFHGDGYVEGDAVDVIENLVQASKTLKHLHIPKNIFVFDDDEGVALPQDTTFPRLTHLFCDSEYYDHEIDLFLSIVRCSPCLETVKSFPPLLKWDHPDPIDLMSSCTRLVNTTVIMDEGQQDLNALKRFINTHIQRGGYSALRSLSIALWTEECAQQLLPLIAQLTLLEDLHLAVSLHSPLGMIMDKVATADAMKIQQLKISIVGVCVQHPVFARLQHAHFLRSLIIDADHLCTMAALSLLEVTQLVHLQIPFEGLNDLTIDILRKQFPNVKELESHHIWGG
ncbi:predicted protein [Lichtheimia corymbifera JMRC:FSU:9682]|uniref:F-box domain-containing protein n=1 Tax=Lichtheimia corymbifera JMRC:FSU:9682 TaxID=1263082 RepID=A0A068RYL4_9FUNG|nr:predicted protein [Lichtheimia corymbifera JMRC:FSU:9682]